MSKNAATKKRKTKAMYGISRIDDEYHRTHAWRVSLRRYGTMFVKNFPDKKYGGKRKALKEAKDYRDLIVRTYPPMTRKDFSNILRSNNRSGITGVYKYKKTYFLKDGTERECWYWEAHWPTVTGGSEKMSFNVGHLGESRAKSLAIEARLEGLRKVDGYFWASENGVAEDTGT